MKNCNKELCEQYETRRIKEHDTDNNKTGSKIQTSSEK